MTDRIVVELLAGKTPRDISAKLGCPPHYVSMVKRRKGFQTKRSVRYFTFEKKETIRELWLTADYCATEIAKEINFPVELVIQYIQAEGLA